MSGYQQPPHAILDIVDQPDEPSISFSPDRTKVCVPFPDTTLHHHLPFLFTPKHSDVVAAYYSLSLLSALCCLLQVLQVYKPPPLPPISELCHAEVKLAGDICYLSLGLWPLAWALVHCAIRSARHLAYPQQTM